MSGRWTVWFLEKGLSKADYDQHKQDVEQLVSKSTWRDLYRIYVDFRLWEEGKVYQSLFSPIREGWYGEAQPDWIHFGDIAGKIMYRHFKGSIDYLRFISSDERQSMDIPVKAIVSTSSAGFPKVAYSVDQYLIGYLGWLDAFVAANQGNLKPLQVLQFQLTNENFSEDIYPRVKDLSRYLLSESHPAQEIDMWIRNLERQMIEEMFRVIPTRCKPPYHHVLEWRLDPKILERKHPLVEAYLKIRAAIPNIVMGRGFIAVPTDPKAFNH